MDIDNSLSRVAALAAERRDLAAQLAVLEKQQPIVAVAVKPGILARLEEIHAELRELRAGAVQEAREIVKAAGEHARLQGVRTLELDFSGWPIPAHAARRFMGEVMGKAPDAS